MKGFLFKTYIMKSILYIIAVILIIGWAISFLGGFVVNGVIHIALVFAVIMILYNLLGGRGNGKV